MVSSISILLMLNHYIKYGDLQEDEFSMLLYNGLEEKYVRISAGVMLMVA